MNQTHESRGLGTPAIEEDATNVTDDGTRAAAGISSTARPNSAETPVTREPAVTPGFTAYDRAAEEFDQPGPVPGWVAKQTPYPAARFEYTDEAGKPLFTVHRGANKTFKQQAADGSWSMKGVRLVLLGLPAVRKAAEAGGVIHVTEGEKDAHALRLEGHVATTAPGGAKAAWLDSYSKSLEGAEVRVWQDKDDPGREHAAAVVKSLVAHGVRCQLVEARTGKDAWDHLAAGWSASQALEVAKPVRLKVTKASEIEIRAVRWLLQDKIAVGTLSLLAGREGIGKSTIAYTFGADLTRGRLPGAFKGRPRSVVVVATEDSWAHTIVPRLMAAGADLDRVLRVEAYSPEGFEDQLSLPADLPGLKRICGQEDVGLIILDPLMSAVDHKLDTHKDREVRKALDPLVRLAEATDSTVQGLIHLNKTGTTDPLNAVMGSKAFAAVARSVLTAMVDEDEKGRYLLGNPKNNLGPSNLPSQLYKITGERVGETGDGEPVWTSKIEWLGEDERTIGDVMQERAQRAGGSKAAECAGWLREYLQEAGRPVPKADVAAAAGAEGYSASTLDRARKKAGVLVTNTSTVPRTSLWSVWSTRSKEPDVTETTDMTDVTDATDATEQRGANTPPSRVNGSDLTQLGRPAETCPPAPVTSVTSVSPREVTRLDSVNGAPVRRLKPCGCDPSDAFNGCPECTPSLRRPEADSGSDGDHSQCVRPPKES